MTSVVPSQSSSLSADARIQSIANPPSACAVCYQEQSKPFPLGHTHQYCPRHRKQVDQQISQIKPR
jgi:hypothetical protein